MAKEVVSVGFAILRRIYTVFMSNFSRRVTRSQLQKLRIGTGGEVRVFVNSDNSNLPQFGSFSLQIENQSDIDFNVEQMAMDIEVSGTPTPHRSRRRSFPVARIDEGSAVIENKNIGHIYGKSTIQAREKAGNVQHYQVEFTFPPWLEDVDRIYARGFLKVQKDLERFIDVSFKEDDFTYEEES